MQAGSGTVRHGAAEKIVDQGPAKAEVATMVKDMALEIIRSFARLKMVLAELLWQTGIGDPGRGIDLM